MGTGNMEFDNVQLDVEFSQASERDNITSNENIALSFGKLSTWFEALVPEGGSSGQILGWKSSGIAEWINSPASMDEKVKVDKFVSTTQTDYLLTGAVASMATTAAHLVVDNADGVASARMRLQKGTTDTIGQSMIMLGNNIASGTSNNMQGMIQMYSSSDKYGKIVSESLTDNRTWALPDKTGTIAMISDIIPVNNGKLTIKGGTTSVAEFTANQSGDTNFSIVAGSNVTVTPDATNSKITIASSDTKVTSVGNHYTPSRDTSADKTASASGATAAWSIDVVKGVTLQTDGKGHVTGLSVTSGKIPANPNTDTKVTSADNHYAPATVSGRDKSASASGATAAWSIDVVKGVTLNTDGKGHVTGISVTSGKIPANPNTDRYVNSAAFTDDSANKAASPVKMTLTRAGSDSATIVGNIPKVSSSSAGVAPKGAAVSTQSQSTKFLREDGSWAAPSYTSIPSNNVTGSGTSGYLAKWNGTNTITNGPQLGSSTTTYLRNDGTWATPTNTNTTYTLGTSGNNVTLTPSSGSVQSITVPYAANAATSGSLKITGYGTGNLTFYQANDDFGGTEGRKGNNADNYWSHYIIANHGNGETYYHYTLRLPFWGSPQYQRKIGGSTATANRTRWLDIITEENYTSYTVTKTGGGASGSWGISITGNASTSTKATQDGDGNTISSTYLRARSSVTTDGGATGWSQIGINQYNNAYPDGVTNKIYSYGAVVSMPSHNVRFDLYYNHNSSTAGAITNGLQYRTGWDNDKKAWRMLLDNDNYGSYMTYTSNRSAYASSDTHILQLGYFVTDGLYNNCTILVSSAFWGNQHGSSDIINYQQSNNTNDTAAIHVTMSRIRIGGSVGRKFYYKADNANNRVYLYVYVTGGNSYGRWNTTVLQSSALTTYWRPSMSENQANSGLTEIAYTGSVDYATTATASYVLGRNINAGLTTSGIQYAVGQLTIGSADGNAKEGSNASYKLWSYPAGGTAVSSTTANIQNLRLYWSSSYYRDIFISPNNYDIYHRAVENNNARAWRKILDSGNYTDYMGTLASRSYVEITSITTVTSGKKYTCTANTQTYKTFMVKFSYGSTSMVQWFTVTGSYAAYYPIFASMSTDAEAVLSVQCSVGASATITFTFSNGANSPVVEKVVGFNFGG